MPDTERERRRQRVREILSRNVIRSQQELQELLWAEGLTTTQATLSRDLRDLGVTKSPEGYVLPAGGSDSLTTSRELQQALRDSATLVEHAGSLVVIRTTAGAARALAADIERARLRHVVGAVAADDTIFLATRSVGQAGELVRYLRKLLRK